MTTLPSHSYYASLRVEGDILVARFEDVLDKEIQDQEWLLEARASVEDWLREHFDLLEQRPQKAQLFRGERCFEFDLGEINQGLEVERPKKAVQIGPGENLFH